MKSLLSEMEAYRACSTSHYGSLQSMLYESLSERKLTELALRVITFRMEAYRACYTSNFARVLVQWRPSEDTTRQVNSLSGCLSSGCQVWLPLDKFPESPQVYKSSFTGCQEALHQHGSAGRPRARRPSADLIDDGQTMKKYINPSNWMKLQLYNFTS